MKALGIISLVLVFVSGSLLAKERQEPTVGNKIDKTVHKWQPLFNGKDFNGWELFTKNGDPEAQKKVFCIDKGGIIHFFRDLPDGFALEDPNALHGALITQQSYSRYILKFEYKWGKKQVNNYKNLQFDSGLYFHISDVSAYPLGIQYQIRYNNLKNISYVAELRGKFDRNWYSKDGFFCPPAKGGVVQASPNGVNPASADAFAHGNDGRWNKCEIIVMGSEYVIYKLNGRVVNMVTDLNWSKGKIGLEAESGEILWRNIMIKEFDKFIPKEKFLQ